MNEILFKFIKYCVVGGTGVFIDFGFTYLCKEKLKIAKYVSHSIGFTIAASSNYVLNRIWTFGSENPNISSEYLYFIVVSLGGLVITNVVIWIFHGKMKFNFYLSKLLAIGIATLWNFLANYHLTFAL